MAKTYSDISGEYMVDQIAALFGLLALQTDIERDAYLKQIASKTNATLVKMKELATEDKLNMNQ